MCVYERVYKRVCFKCRNRSLTNGSAEGCICQCCLKSQRRVNLSESLHLVFDRLDVCARPSSCCCVLLSSCQSEPMSSLRCIATYVEVGVGLMVTHFDRYPKACIPGAKIIT